MSYRNLVKNKVRQAFNKVGDLAFDAVLMETNSSTFDFTTQTTNKTVLTNKTIKVILVKEEATEADSNVISGEVMLISEDAGDLTYYDKISINSIVWNIVATLDNNGYTTTIKVKRELNG
jgi:hypothetical protein